VEEDRQIEAGGATEQSDKVVRLPRDWLGPREHLVPFSQSTPPLVEPELDAFAPNDFWGERAAAIHSVVQAPEDDAPEEPPAGESEKVRAGRRRLAAAAFVGIAAVAALAVLLGGSPSRVTSGPRLNIAAILNTGVSRILKGGPPHVVAHTTPPRPVRHVRHHVPRPKPAPARVEHHSSRAPVSTYVARASTSSLAQASTSSPPPARTSPRIVTSAHRTQPAASASTTVSPTGQNGALGPVQSPNG
jgi:hypothetical protein